MTNLKRIFVVGHMGAGKFIFTDALAKKLNWQLVDANPSMECYESIATVIIDSKGCSDDDAEINKIVDEDVNKIITAIGRLGA